MSIIPPQVRAIFFDAVGTLIHPHPPVGDVYAAAGARFGSRRTRAEVSSRFRSAFQVQELLDRAAEHRTSEARELERWRAIVADVFDDATDPAGCFRLLYEHFSGPDAWRVEPDTAATLRTLADRGFALGICSNFDGRLHGLVAKMPELSALRHLIISSEVGWKKPAPQFFGAVASAAALSPGEILIVGDDPTNDYEGGRAAGFAALLIDGPGKSKPGRIERLSDLVR